MLKFSLAACLLMASALQAEVHKVTINWRAESCDERCLRLLEPQLRKISGVRALKVSEGGGSAELFWKPRSPFSYDMVNLVMKRIGLRPNETSLEIRGTINHSGNQFYISSLGDSTRLQLLSPALRSEDQYVELQSVVTHLIRDPLRSQLMEAEKNHLLVTVKGPLFQPHRDPTLMIANSIQIESVR